MVAVPDKIARMVQSNDAEKMLGKTLGRIVVADAKSELLFAQHLLELAKAADADTSVQIIMEHYMTLDAADTMDKIKFDIPARLIESHLLTDDTLMYVLGCTDVTFQDVCINVMTLDAGPNITPLLHRAAKLFHHDLTADVLRELKELAVEKANYMAEGVFKELLRNYTPWSQKPDYIITRRDKVEGVTRDLVASKLSGLDLSITEDPDDTASARYIIRKRLETMMGIKLAQGRENQKQFTAMLAALESTSGPKEQAELRHFLNLNTTSAVSAPTTHQIEGISELFKVLGPINKFMSVTDTVDNPEGRCAAYGCRMLTCQCYYRPDQDFESDDEYGYDRGADENTTDWFTGACLTCDTRIPRACYAIRRPLQTGGWSGTYCSFDCVTRDTGIEPLTPVEESMVRIIREQLTTIGVYDRSDDAPHPYAESDSDEE